ncbi:MULTISPECIES: hybrid sensor histidine kinase/response regulator [Moorena]|uniref:histidine kinase n=2 Tax=Moorena TaxID=1155738 RepID=F4XZC0_9CYAN|nr:MULTISPECIES: hybrid sensor histidine kinase/response regulator [Moorena]EGJ30063.1 chemotaxis protein, histidine kinase family [Moorena producens 3L]NEP34112.1 hybrid sensor histidine kinase/response regulator [Moorena sp. SIO3B2]NEP67134.1 hybrid sensor histidine kinase/response regulator [Moorena sp. SIO3A5]NEQ06490.1 hybrid sensor histidine kinase/response regulator [Moorena sp. SIO4E2]NER88769.1 hybrid sensor histidine kinase/response regulator [Moorena sp. SIO3A2]
MTNDPKIREQSYRYFLQEAPELLQVLENDLLSLSEHYSINKVNNLMRTTHTLKGAAASIGLETIATVAHSLEDVFKALFNPDLSINPEIEALLFQAYECLRLPLTAELTGGQIDDTEIKNRTAAVVAQLQEKLGDCFGLESYLPTSVELGFDVTQSIFEVGVSQGLDLIQAALNSDNPTEISITVRNQADIFLGLGQSLNLPGFAAIAKNAIAALDNHPEQVVTIAKTALCDFVAAQAAVLEGDRTQGGQPSMALQQLADLRSSIPNSQLIIHNQSSVLDNGKEQDLNPVEPGVKQEEGIVNNSSVTHPESKTSKQSQLVEMIWGGSTTLDDQTSDQSKELQRSEQTEIDVLDGEIASPEQEVGTEKNFVLHNMGMIDGDNENKEEAQEPEVITDEIIPPIGNTINSPLNSSHLAITPSNQHPSTPSSRDKSGTVRINIEHLEYLNYTIGELLTNQNRQLLENEQLLAAVRVLQDRVHQHQQVLDQLQDWYDRLFILMQQKQIRQRLQVSKFQVEGLNKNFATDSNPSFSSYPWAEKTLQVSKFHVEGLKENFATNPNPTANLDQKATLRSQPTNLQPTNLQPTNLQPTNLQPTNLQPTNLQPTNLQPTNLLDTDYFDDLELKRYSTPELLIQSVLEDAIQLTEAAYDIELFTTQSSKTLEQQRRLLTNHRDVLMEARMLPLGEIFSRFPPVLKQLSASHHKLVELKISGNDVLVDKVVAQKLYDPLLHLVRNAFDHGIETPALRQQQGKPENGLIEITACHRGRHLVIEVKDDGPGLNFKRIRQLAVERELIDLEQSNSLSEAQLRNLLFEPGFSTVSGVNNLSGRGVGLDVVLNQVKALRGSVQVDSSPDLGTRFRLQIPLSLTIGKLLLCQAGKQVYGLITDQVKQIIIPQEHQLRSWEDGKVLHLGTGSDQQLVKVYQLGQILDYSSLASPFSVTHPHQPVVPKQTIRPIILIHYQDQLVGLEVEQLLGDQELVIRPLGTMIVPPPYVNGGSILADGRLTLVLDGTELIQYLSDQRTDGSQRLKVSTLKVESKSDDQATQAMETLSRKQLPPSLVEPFWVRHKPKVLLVDDSITLRQTLAMTLGKNGYQVFQAQDGYEAIEQLQHQKDIQLVICDIEMPRMNGFEFLKHCQQDPALVDIPVVILTSRSNDKHRLIAAQLGAKAYITKPYLEHKLLTTVTDVVEPISPSITE